ncbi:MAG: argininosuccinate lyase, partial [Cyclobacteriaceae bacterium]|nr:argininosuccinate lyase [Cyclobacteriaceae bacterium HetDA_MAG_MS6]
SIQVTPNILKDERYDLLFTVEEVNEAVLSGVPFRDAYQQIAKKIKDGTYQSKKDLNHTHVGSIGNLTNDRIEAAFEKEYEYFVG